MVTGPILALPENEETFLLDTDAFDTGLDAVLSRLQTGKKRVIAYAFKL